MFDRYKELAGGSKKRRDLVFTSEVGKLDAELRWRRRKRKHKYKGHGFHRQKSLAAVSRAKWYRILKIHKEADTDVYYYNDERNVTNEKKWKKQIERKQINGGSCKNLEWYTFVFL